MDRVQERIDSWDRPQSQWNSTVELVVAECKEEESRCCYCGECNGKVQSEKTFRLDDFVTAFFVHHQNFDSVFKFYNSTTFVQRRFASRIKRRRWIDQTARKLVDVTEREARRRHRHGNINVKITFAVGANIDHPCFRGHKGGRLPNRKLIQVGTASTRCPHR